MANHSLNFAGQDCRDRSFRNQNLNGADFQEADLRGCDFSAAQLIQANFQGAIFGQSRRQTLTYWLWCLGVGLFAGNELATIIFDVLGSTFDDQLWKTKLLLVCVMGLGGTLALANFLWRFNRSFKHILQLALSILAFSLVGLALIVSTLGDYLSTQQAILGVGAVGLTGGLLYRNCRQVIAQLGWHVLNLSMAYSFAFWVGTNATMLASVGYWGWGSAIAVIALLYLWLCWRSCQILLGQIQTASGTLFRKANLIGAQFGGSALQHCDFTGAILTFPGHR